MKAAVLLKTGEPLRVLDDVSVPSPEFGQVLVKVGYSGVCHSQLMEVRGHRGPDKWVPHLLGHEGTGVVETVGEGVSRFKKGDHVILGWLKGEGCNVGGTQYEAQGMKINSGAVTTFSEYTIVSENRLTPLPDFLPPDLAVLFGCALPTGAGILINDIQPRSGTRIAVLGLGGIGLSALIATKLYEFKDVVAIDINDDKLNLAKELGATATINSKTQDVNAVVGELTSGEGFDYCIEAAGLIQTIELGFSIINRSHGLLVFASHPKFGEKISLDPHELISGKQIRGSWGGGCKPDKDIPHFFSMFEKGDLPLDRLIDHRYSLDQINQALDELETGKTKRPLIEIDPTIFN